MKTSDFDPTEHMASPQPVWKSGLAPSGAVTPAIPGTMLLVVYFDTSGGDAKNIAAVCHLPVVAWRTVYDEESTSSRAIPVTPWEMPDDFRTSQDASRSSAVQINKFVYSLDDWGEFPTEEAWVAACKQLHLSRAM